MKQRYAILLFTALLGCFIASCSSKEPALIPESDLHIGVAPFTQPETLADLMAGYISDTVPRIDAKIFPQLDNDFADLLAEMSTRNFIGLDKSRECMQKNPKPANTSAFNYWLAIGTCMDVDFLVVPQIHNWQERKGSEMGVEAPASVSVDIFLLDVVNRTVLARSRYDEKQRALLDNLIDVGKFIERKGRWVSAATLAKEGMFKAIKDFGL